MVRDPPYAAGLPAVQGSAQALAPPVFAAAGERYYKVSAEALRVCEQLVRVIRPDATAPLQPALKVSWRTAVLAARPRTAVL